MARILVVDDEESIRKIFQLYLTQEGHSVEVAADGELAFKMVRQMPFDLVITDIFMPNKDGLQLIRDLRSELPAIKIIALSGGSRRFDLNTLQTAGHLGASAILDKPVDIFKFSQAIQAVLGGAQAENGKG